MRVIGRMGKDMVLVNMYLPMERYLRDNIDKILEMEKELFMVIICKL